MRPTPASRLARLAPALLATGLLLGACVGTAAPGWTFEPPPPATASPSAAPSGSATASGSATPSGSASAAPSPSSGGATINIAAANTAFDQSALNAPAGQGFQIVFQNNDASVQHNVEIKDGTGASVFRGALVTGVGSATYTVPALAAGAYTFNCTVHPSMNGTLTVK